jgi:hypothetical protein
MPMNMFKTKRTTGTALTPIDDVVDNLPFVVRRDHRIIAAFAKLRYAQDWSSEKSFSDESPFTIHTASEVIETYRDGEPTDA